MAEPKKIPPLSSPEARQVEWLIPADAADFLEERPNAPRYQGSIVIDGQEIELGGPAFPKRKRRRRR